MDKENKKINYLFYGILLTALLLIAIYILFGGTIPRPRCYIYSEFGIYCPGCGCTRAFKSMLRGEFIQSLIFNPTVMYYTVIIFIYMLCSVLDKVLKKNISSKIHIKLLFYIGVAIFICTWIIKNIILFL
ncbi:MAG: DUF2752 domain-containing protein [Clostridia bacterium]|nr:DUF2752 domain-containing protein [Clostridia bacterium]